MKVVTVAREKVFQHTAIDDCTRMHVLRLYPRLNQQSSLTFLRELVTAFPFPIRKVQCANGTEFPLAFRLAVEAGGTKHRYIRPRWPKQNGKVERSQLIDSEEFWNRQRFSMRAEAERVSATESGGTTTSDSHWHWPDARRRKSSRLHCAQPFSKGCAHDARS